jgi:hypothetical protein
VVGFLLLLFEDFFARGKITMLPPANYSNLIKRKTGVEEGAWDFRTAARGLRAGLKTWRRT